MKKWTPAALSHLEVSDLSAPPTARIETGFTLPILKPELQISFAKKLENLRDRYLSLALSSALEKIELKVLDKELGEFVPSSNLKVLAKLGLRGELLFAVPCLLVQSPHLLGYYRLVLGFSQKEFYKKGFGQFKSMETEGQLSDKGRDNLESLCRSLNGASSLLMLGLGSERLSKDLLGELALLTLGTQLRGSWHNEIGAEGIEEVFQLIKSIVTPSLVAETGKVLSVVNAAGRPVSIEFAADPDIVFKENVRKMLAIEVKGGTDFSNVHNRIGEAEKSHQKAKNDGFTEFWNTEKFSEEGAKKESPTTTRFYLLSELKSSESDQARDFRHRIIALIGQRDE